MIRPLKTMEIFAEEKVTRVDSLSLVLSGKYVTLYTIYYFYLSDTACSYYDSS